MELPPLPRSTILLVEVGSSAHGTGIPGGEDYDQLGVVAEMPEEVIGLDERGFRTVMQRTQPEGSRSGPVDIDRTLYSLRRFVRLAASGNPSILMALWAPVDHSTSEGEELQALGDAFIAATTSSPATGATCSPRPGDSSAAPVVGMVVEGADDVRNWSRRTATRPNTRCTAPGSATSARSCSPLGRLTLPIQGEPAEWLRLVEPPA